MARAFPAHSLERTNACTCMVLSGVEAWGEQVCKTDAVVGSSDQSCLSAASWSLVWATAVMSPAEIVQKTDRNSRDFASGGQAFYEHCWNGEGEELTRCLYFMSSMTEALISEGFKRPILWDHRIKDYHKGLCWQGMEEPFPDTENQ
jgi:hypothetical protein